MTDQCPHENTTYTSVWRDGVCTDDGSTVCDDCDARLTGNGDA